MLFDYWTVSVVPDPMGITSIGAGVVVVDPRSNEVRSRFRSRQFLRGFDKTGALKAALKDFTRQVEDFEEDGAVLDLGGNLTLPGYLSIVTDHWMNEVRVGGPAHMDAESVDAAAELLFTTLIGGTQATPRQKTVKQLRKYVRAQYEQFPSLRDASIFGVPAIIKDRELDLNLSVVSASQVFELNQVFNFQARDTTNILNDVDRWTLKVDKLRAEGAVLDFDGVHICVPPTVKVTAPVYLPESTKQQDAFDKFKAFCKQADIAVIPSQSIGEHARELDGQLAA